MEREHAAKLHKQARATLDPTSVAQVSFEVGETPVTAVIVPKDQIDGYAVGVFDVQMPDKSYTRRYLKMPKHIMESKQAVIEFYDDHDKLVKGVGALAVVGGIVGVGSLFVRRRQARRAH